MTANTPICTAVTLISVLAGPGPYQWGWPLTGRIAPSAA